MSAQPLNLYDVDAYTASKKGQVVANYAGDDYVTVVVSEGVRRSCYCRQSTT